MTEDNIYEVAAFMVGILEGKYNAGELREETRQDVNERLEQTMLHVRVEEDQ